MRFIWNRGGITATERRRSHRSYAARAPRANCLTSSCFPFRGRTWRRWRQCPRQDFRALRLILAPFAMLHISENRRRVELARIAPAIEENALRIRLTDAGNNNDIVFGGSPDKGFRPVQLD